MTPAHPMAPLAADLSPAEAEQRAKECFELEQEIRTCIQIGRAAGWQMAGALYRFNEAHGWTALDHETLGSWLADPDIGITEPTYHRMVDTWRTAVVHGGIQEDHLKRLDPSKVALVLPALKARESGREEIMADVEVLGWRDLRTKYPPKNPRSEGATSANSPKRDIASDEAAELLDEWRTKSSGPTANLSRAQLRVAGDAMAEFIAARYSS